ncbi:MAG: heavy metal-binding domain-containing protein [Ignavibacteriaceae bacterium]
MKTKIILLMTLAAAIILAFSGCGNSEDHDTMHNDETMEKVESPMVRAYDVDVSTLDENKDGNVYQCPMDWEVISDHPGSCPLCNMDLKEYSVADAQQNLKENKPHEY